MRPGRSRRWLETGPVLIRLWRFCTLDCVPPGVLVFAQTLWSRPASPREVEGWQQDWSPLASTPHLGRCL